MNLSTAFGVFDLQRFPASTDTSLRAWDAADELLIAHVADTLQSLSDGDNSSVLICNDAQGALACALHRFKPVLWSDSSLSHTATSRNWQKSLLPGAPQYVDSVSTPPGTFDLVLIKIPKTHALLEDQLARLRPLLHANSVVVAAGMVRHLQRSVFALFERYTGELSTSLARKKARLIFCRPDSTKPVLESPYPDCYTDKELNITMSNHANVFCRDHVDIGARLFLSQIHRLPKAANIIDLACGNGILGIHVQKSQSDAHVQFIDESYMSVASARENYTRMISRSTASPEFTVGNALDASAPDSVDLIVCNPPFHVQHAVADDTARLFFRQAARCLRSQGELWIVANRHLSYRSYLKRWFRQCERIADNGAFVVLRAFDGNSSR